MSVIGSQPITRYAARTGNHGIPTPTTSIQPVSTPVVPEQSVTPIQAWVPSENVQRDAQRALLGHQEAVRFNNEWNSYPEPKVSAMVPQVMLGTSTDTGFFSKASNWDLDGGNANIYSSPNKAAGTGIIPNEEVMEKQRMLNRRLGTNLKIDGIDGPKTQKASDMWMARQEADIHRLGAEEMASRQAQAPATQIQEPTQQPAQGGWGYNKEATDRMHQQWLNNELPEGAVPTAVYDGPPEGLAAKVAGWFK
jgi:peptidoglycan hydrolase-like protein with peptidoglycan-binding domain